MSLNPTKRNSIFFRGKWLWLSWESGRFWHQRYQVWVHLFGNFIYCQLNRKFGKKVKEAWNCPFKKAVFEAEASSSFARGPEDYTVTGSSRWVAREKADVVDWWWLAQRSLALLQKQLSRVRLGFNPTNRKDFCVENLNRRIEPNKNTVASNNCLNTFYSPFVHWKVVKATFNSQIFKKQLKRYFFFVLIVLYRTVLKGNLNQPRKLK